MSLNTSNDTLHETLEQQSSMHKVIVVGGGLAGLSASIEAARNGASVVLIEKEKNVGGNSAKASSGMNSVVSDYQKKMNINDTVQLFNEDTTKSGHGTSVPSLVDVLTKESRDALIWVESFGLKLDAVSHCGGHSMPRSHRESPRADGKPAPVGWDIIKSLKEYIITDLSDAKLTDQQQDNAQITETSIFPKPGKVNVLSNTKVTDILFDEGPEKLVTGVKYFNGDSEKVLSSNAVVLATGGYGNDFQGEGSLLSRFSPALKHLATTNGPWATGDGVKIGEKIGAWLYDMDKVQVHPTGFVDPKDPSNKVKFLAPEYFRAHGGLLISPSTSTRFVNELTTRDIVTEAIFTSCPPLTSGSESTALLVIPQSAVDKFDKASFGFYVHVKGFFKVYENLDGFVDAEGLDGNALKQDLETYNELVGSDGKVDKFGKTRFPESIPFSDSKLYVAKVTPSIHYTMGGLKINENAQILTDPSISPGGSHNASIKGLFGAGEVTGGVHGHNRLAGNSLLECVVFGRIAGKQASLKTL